MVRLGSVALMLIFLPVAAWSNPPESANAADRARSFHMPRPSQEFTFGTDHFGRAEIGPGAHFGFGIFGLKQERSHLRPVTVREIDAPKQRRPAVGFSLKF